MAFGKQGMQMKCTVCKLLISCCLCVVNQGVVRLRMSLTHNVWFPSVVIHAILDVVLFALGSESALPDT